MLRRTLIALALLSCAFIFVGQAQAQRHPDFDAKSKASKSRVKAKAKTVTTNKAHDRYANQEVSYLKSDGNEVAKSRKKTTTNVWGDPHVNESSKAKTAKPNNPPTHPNQTQTSQIFMGGGNDSWNTRKKPASGKSSRCMYPLCGGKTSTVNKLKSDGNEVAIESLERKSATPFDKGTLPPAVKTKTPGTTKPNSPPVSNLVTDGEESSGTGGTIESPLGETTSDAQAPNSEPADTEPSKLKRKVKKILKNRQNETKP